jgi:hypothetical protein
LKIEVKKEEVCGRGMEKNFGLQSKPIHGCVCVGARGCVHILHRDQITSVAIIIKSVDQDANKDPLGEPNHEALIALFATVTQNDC